MAAPYDSFVSSRETESLEGKCEDTLTYRKADGGRTYGPEVRFCLFLTGPVWSAASDGAMFMRSSKVVIVILVVENAKNETKEK